MADLEKKPADERFYEHLDACEHCREHPFDLCAAGARLLQAAAEELPGLVSFGPAPEVPRG